MKNLIATILVVSTFTVSAACTINLDKKKAGAKTSYISGVSVSAKIQEALSSQCELTYRVMSKQEATDMRIKTLKAQLLKLTK